MEENIKELTKKAEQGDVKAQVELADNYYYGKNVEQDYGKAIFWSRKAAEQDNQKLEKATLNADVRVITEIGLYYRSINTFEKAQKYFEKAVAKNYGPAEFFLGEIFRDKKNNLEAVIKLYEKAAEYSSDSAQKLADMYEYGDGLKQNYKKSLKWYLKAAEMEESYAQYCLGFKYEYGIGVEKNINESIKWYNLAIKNGDVSAKFRLGLLYYFGNGFEVDYKKAKELWTEVAKKIDWSFSSKAQYFLGLLFYYGNGVEIDYGITMKYFLLASSRWSFAPAMNKIGELYEKGLGMEQDYTKAKSYYKKAADKNYEEAINALKELDAKSKNIS